MIMNRGFKIDRCELNSDESVEIKSMSEAVHIHTIVAQPTTVAEVGYTRFDFRFHVYFVY